MGRDSWLLARGSAAPRPSQAFALPFFVITVGFATTFITVYRQAGCARMWC
jgi:hypothetical protein